MQTLVLLYNLTDDTPAGKALRRIFPMRGIACRDIPEHRLEETISSLLENPDGPAGDAPNSGDAPDSGDSAAAPPEVRDSHLLLMCGFDEAMLDRFLADMRAEGVRIPHKAMLTEHNINFTAAQLIEDIAREHAMMQMMAQMRQQ